MRHRIDYEGQAAIELEVLADSAGEHAAELRMDVRTDGVIDPAGLVRAMVSARRGGVEPAALAAGFHRAVADAVSQVVGLVADEVRTVGLPAGSSRTCCCCGEADIGRRGPDRGVDPPRGSAE